MNKTELFDPFADALESYWRTGHGKYRYRREDGWSSTEDAWWYFTSYPDFPRVEKQALRFARGRVLDVGCGAGRHALYLQRKGLHVTAVESSVRVAALAVERGVRDVRVLSACRTLPFSEARFDTVLLFGNNLGICGTREGILSMLRELARVTTVRGRILATTMIPGIFDSTHAEYWSDRIERGGGGEMMTFELTFQGGHARTVRLAAFSPVELVRIAYRAGWGLKRIFTADRAADGYAVVLEKRRRRRKKR